MPKMTLKAIERQIAVLKGKAEKVGRKKEPALRKIAQLMRVNDISIDDLRGPRGGSGRGRNGASPLKGRKAKIMYRNRKTGETWSGRGRAARWIVAAEKAGKKREVFLIKRK